MAESIFAMLKRSWCTNRLGRHAPKARAAIFEQLEVFDNLQRRHSSLGYLSPVAFEQQYEQKRETP